MAETMTTTTYRLILASSSPRRKDLLGQAGYAFEVVGPPFGEPGQAIVALPPAQLAAALAYYKARSVADHHPQDCVLGADTVVSVQDRVLGKPTGPHEAREMLRLLSGTRHSVITGVAIIAPDRRLIATDTTYVTMRAITNDEIEAYVASYEWEGKAGAYAIQETADRFVVNVEGSFSNIVGLPMELVQRLLKKIGISSAV